MAVKAVIDTNIWVSALLNPHGFPAKILKGFKKNLFQSVVSEPMLEELVEVFRRPRIKDKYGITEDEIKELIILIEEKSEHVFPSGTLELCRDKDDNFILETALYGRVEYLVTRDDDLKFDLNVSDFLLKNGIVVISVSKFLTVLSKK
jgi:putative PIN family toxin of toxin-antitoxin system